MEEIDDELATFWNLQDPWICLILKIKTTRPSYFLQNIIFFFNFEKNTDFLKKKWWFWEICTARRFLFFSKNIKTVIHDYNPSRNSENYRKNQAKTKQIHEFRSRLTPKNQFERFLFFLFFRNVIEYERVLWPNLPKKYKNLEILRFFVELHCLAILKITAKIKQKPSKFMSFGVA